MVEKEQSNTHVAPLRRPTSLAQKDRQEWDQRKKVIDLYDTLRPSLYAYLACLGLSSEESEDITQECFLRLLRHLLEERPENNLRAWIFRVAYNLSMDIHRLGQRQQVSSADDIGFSTIRSVDTALTPEQQVMNKERLQHLEKAISLLTPQQRHCVLLRAEGLRYREIASVLGVSTPRVAELLQRALLRLAARL
jgi:RNA polymerase sigma-70 factor (ECF subfamily)